MAVSGRAGLFTIDDKRRYDLRGDPYATGSGQKSGASRLEFGKVLIPSAATATASVRMTVNTGVMAVVSPGKVPVSVVQASGTYVVATSGSFLSGFLHIDVQATGSYSGQFSGAQVNYMVVGY